MANSYAGLADHYDLIMTSGYYDYDAYAEDLLSRIGEHRDLLELGVGTGLVCERLLEREPPGLQITGIDHTESMLARARTRLGGRVRLIEQDIVDAAPPHGFDVAYSVGGIWYCVHDQGRTWLGSHLVNEVENVKGLENLAAALRPGGVLLLAVQEAHRPYRRPLSNGLVYAQDVQTDGDGRFTKDYLVIRENTVVARQRLGYRLYPEEQADQLLEACGFRLEPDGANGLFRQYLRV